MKKFAVKLGVEEVVRSEYVVEVEAKNKDEAIRKIEEMIVQGDSSLYENIVEEDIGVEVLETKKEEVVDIYEMSDSNRRGNRLENILIQITTSVKKTIEDKYLSPEYFSEFELGTIVREAIPEDITIEELLKLLEISEDNWKINQSTVIDLIVSKISRMPAKKAEKEAKKLLERIPHSLKEDVLFAFEEAEVLKGATH